MSYRQLIVKEEYKLFDQYFYQKAEIERFVAK